MGKASCIALALLITLLCAGCGDSPAPSADDGAPVAAEAEPVARPALAVSPDSASEAWAAEAIEAWSAVADIYIDSAGIQIRTLPEAEMWTPCIINGEPKSCLPSAKWEGGEIMVRETAACPARSIAHEIGHAIGLDHLPAPSLMQSPAPSGCPEWSVGEDVAAALGLM